MTEEFLNLKTNIEKGHIDIYFRRKKHGTLNCMPVKFNHKLSKIGECIFVFGGNIPFNKKYLVKS